MTTTAGPGTQRFRGRAERKHPARGVLISQSGFRLAALLTAGRAWGQYLLMTEPRQVVVTDFVHGSTEAEQQVLGDVARVVALGCRHEDELAGRVEDADAIMQYHTMKLTRRTLERLKRCKLIVRCGVGYDNVDYAFARERGIPVANVPDYGTEEVADSAIGMMLALARGVVQLGSLMRSGARPWLYTHVAPLHRLRGQVCGLVGVGRIGSAAALRAKALSLDVVFYDPYVPSGYEKALGVRRVLTFDELLAQSRFLSLHCPLTAETRHMVDARALARLPRGAFLVNTARGGIVDTTALPEALATGRLAGAGIDVLEHEPPADDDPLVVAWRDPNHPAHHRLILTPHAAFYSEEGFMEMRVKGAEACRLALLGQAIPNVVNRV
jgi:C-terminal binding protein